ncbi:MAG: chemotaxis protein CheB [Hyphomicrobiales bacterium]
MSPDDNLQQKGGDSDEQLRNPPVVGIGASAGGVAALQTFFESLPDRVGAAFVVIIHLAPDFRSDLAGLLANWTRLQVSQVAEPRRLEADHVYVIPPNRRLHITRQKIAAAEFDEPRERRAPIDGFFQSLADQHGDAFAVVLTGAGSDGTAGVKAIKEAGGIILVQDPREAEYASMPRSAIATGLADFVLPVGELARCLVELIETKDKARTVPGGQVDDELLRLVLGYVRARTGHDFAKYKRSTVLRRIARRMQVAKQPDLRAYYSYLTEKPEEAQQLLSDLLISVTTFFRDAQAFEALAAQVVPHLFTIKKPSTGVRVWIAGCATGEEAYTLGILLLEEAARQETPPPIQIFASDPDIGALATGREGRYPLSIEADLTEDRLGRFFSREDDHYRVKQELRDIVLFASHSILRDPPFSRIDLISCRNLLIYLDRDLQQQACTAFHYALNPGGFLFLGASESADSPAGLFRTVDRKYRIYQTTAQSGDKPRLPPRLLGTLATREIAPANRPAAQGEMALHRQALEATAPPSVLVDDVHRVVHLSDNAGRYFQPAGGPLTGDIVDLVRPELRFELRSALHKAFERRQPTLTMPILVKFNGAPHRVYLQVKPADQQSGPSRYAIVLFIEGDAITPDVTEIGGSQSQASSVDNTLHALTEELEATQSRLRTMREESDAANEDLRAANEELQSTNEEYRSTSEELETSKEELQSINEELQTVNNELKLKLETVSRAHGDLQNLMAATDFATLFLDQSLRIKRLISRVTELFNITSSDEGRPITDFTHNLEYGALAEDARAVLGNLIPIEREVQSRSGRWYLMRMRPYRTVEDKIDGVVITFLDITERLRVEEALRHSEEQLRQKQRLIDLSREAIFIWDFDDGIVDWNRGSERLYGYTREETLGQRKDQLLKTSVPGSSFLALTRVLLDQGTWSGELLHRTKDGRELIAESRLELRLVAGRRLVLETTRDITDRKEWERQQQMLLGELTHRVKNTLAIVQSIAHQTLTTSKSKEDFVRSLDGRLAALASAHTLLVDTNWRGADLSALARHQLEPLTEGDLSRLRIDGEPIVLPSDLATPFGLVLHELATNATKHGALSNGEGTVDLSWHIEKTEPAPKLVLVWRETGGPPLPADRTRGFGTSLIERAIPNAKVRQEYLPDGLVCTIELPVPERTVLGVI